MNLKASPKQAESIVGGLFFDDQMREHRPQQCCNILGAIQIPDSDWQPPFRLCSFGVVSDLAPNVLEKPLHDPRSGTVNSQFSGYGSSIVLVPELQIPFAVEQAAEVTQISRIARDLYGSAVRTMGPYLDPGCGNSSLDRGVVNAEGPAYVGHTHSALIGADYLSFRMIPERPAAGRSYRDSRPREPTKHSPVGHGVFVGQFGAGSSSNVFLSQGFSRRTFSMKCHAISYHENDPFVLRSFRGDA